MGRLGGCAGSVYGRRNILRSDTQPRISQTQSPESVTEPELRVSPCWCRPDPRSPKLARGSRQEGESIGSRTGRKTREAVRVRPAMTRAYSARKPASAAASAGTPSHAATARSPAASQPLASDGAGTSTAAGSDRAPAGSKPVDGRGPPEPPPVMAVGGVGSAAGGGWGWAWVAACWGSGEAGGARNGRAARR